MNIYVDKKRQNNYQKKQVKLDLLKRQEEQDKASANTKVREFSGMKVIGERGERIKVQDDYEPTKIEDAHAREVLSAANKKFFNDVKSFVDNQIKTYETKMTNLEDSYQKKNWAIDKSKGKFKVYGDRIADLKSYKTDIEAIEIAVTSNGGDDLLTLMNVVHNEAGSYSSSAKTAVAYAYLNRIGYKEGGGIREPVNGSEISHYSELGDRWSGYSITSEKLQFLGSIKSSFDAVNARYSNKGMDPTSGSTHWVSPVGLANRARVGYYQRTHSGITTYFPDWARSNEWVKKNLTKAKKWFNVDDYKEIKATGVSGEEFLFYKGVKY